MPESEPQRPRLYTIPPTAPFLITLARAILNGDLPSPGGAKLDPLTLPLATIYVPTRRAARGLREAFLDASGGKAALLPRIRTLGDPDEDAAIIFGAEGENEGRLSEAVSAPAIDPLSRRLALMRLVLAWSTALATQGAADKDDVAGIPRVPGPAQASFLAADLGRLMDFLETEEVSLGLLKDLVPEDHAVHWQLTIDFLSIVTEHWPRHLREKGLISAAARRDLLMHAEAERLQKRPQAGPVIAAGSTGTVPATARLLKIIAHLQNGAVVLPGLDLSLDDESWAKVSKHAEHPQAGMAELLAKLGAARSDVAYVAGSEPASGGMARLKMVSEALRPASRTDAWQSFLARDEGSAMLETALAGVQLIEAPTAHDESEAIALILRSVAETPDRTAALVTPDRTLARRVAARLKGFDLLIDDSAGVPVARTLPGAFLDLILGAVENGFAPADLMALLKHPLTLVGRHPRDIRGAARSLERGAFRDVYVGQNVVGVAEAIKSDPSDGKRSRKRLWDGDREVALQLVADLESAFAPLSALFAGEKSKSAATFAAAHVTVAEALARDHRGSSADLWLGEAGEALSTFFAELIAAGNDLEIAAADYPGFYRSLLIGRVARPRRPAHPRLFIWGPLEARLQQPDVLILGSLNEGSWPRPQEASPWLSRPMAERLGLPPPERRIGLAAHDFEQCLGAGTVYLTRAIKVEGVPTVPSRWIQRLKALTEAAGFGDRLAPAEPWVEWAGRRDKVPDFRPAEAPRPCPPLAARPRKLSVSRIEKMLANPYDIYARNILKLEPMLPVGTEPGAALYGTIVHAALSEFAQTYPTHLPDDIASRLTAIADRLFEAQGGSPRVKAFWRPSFERFALWFAESEPVRRSDIVRLEGEVDGSMLIETQNPFTLTARADRIDIAADGSVLIYDYKSGFAPSQANVDELHAPQLPLEAAIATAGGFADLGPRSVRALRYIRASGRRDGGDEVEATKNGPASLGDRAVNALRVLIERFDLPETPYAAARRSASAFRRVYPFDDYAQLARVQEWASSHGEGEAS